MFKLSIKGVKGIIKHLKTCVYKERIWRRI